MSSPSSPGDDGPSVSSREPRQQHVVRFAPVPVTIRAHSMLSSSDSESESDSGSDVATALPSALQPHVIPAHSTSVSDAMEREDAPMLPMEVTVPRAAGGNANAPPRRRWPRCSSVHLVAVLTVLAMVAIVVAIVLRIAAARHPQPSNPERQPVTQVQCRLVAAHAVPPLPAGWQRDAAWPLSLWPAPQWASQQRVRDLVGERVLSLGHRFIVECPDVYLMWSAAQRACARAHLPETSAAAPVLSRLVVTVREAPPARVRPPRGNESEAYQLELRPASAHASAHSSGGAGTGSGGGSDGGSGSSAAAETEFVALLTADTFVGALRGLESFTQMLLPDGTVHPEAPVALRDAPAFSWRGLMLDTSRHFVPLQDMRRTLDAMAMSKLSVLHWHITDAHSFPLHVPALPQLARNGSWSPAHTYTAEDVQELVGYAALRGIRIVPEIDMPAHTASWGRGEPGVIAHCPRQAQWSDSDYLNKLALNPALERTFEVIEAVLDHVTALFPDEVLHVGGDEVDMQCWESDPHVKALMRDKKLTSAQLFQRFFDRVSHMARARNRTLAFWQDVMSSSFRPPPGSIVLAWKCWSGLGQRGLLEAVRSGLRAVQSTCWYLDFDSDWTEFYGKQQPLPPAPAALTKEEERLVIGGQACMWTENTDWTNLHCRVWPRAAAVAERLWSGAMVKPLSDTADRLHGHAQRLAALGIHVAPVAPPTEALASQLSAEGQTRRPRRLANLGPRGDAVGYSGVGDAPHAGWNTQCPKVHQQSQRALRGSNDTLLVLQLNLDYGGGEVNGLRFAALRDWVLSQGAWVLGAVEANGWNDSFGVSSRAGELGFPFSHLMAVESGFHLAVLAVTPITVVRELRTGFQRGVLHVLVDGVNIVVAHLHAHSAQERRKEAAALAAYLRSVPAAPLLLMGDLNTLSPGDAACHDFEGVLEFAQQPTETRLRDKFLTADATALDYRPMRTLLAMPLRDVVLQHASPAVALLQACGALNSTVARRRCAARFCLHTEPTSIAPDQVDPNEQLPPLRVDYVLSNVEADAALQVLACAPVYSNATATLSDHFPIRCELASRTLRG